MKTSRILLVLPIFFLFLSACAGGAGEAPAFNPTIEADEICSQVMNNTYRTAAVYQIGVEDGAPVFAPFMISFLLDGRAIWNYEDGASYIGTFECRDGVISARFEEGTVTNLDAVYDPQTESILIEGVEYLVVKEL